MTCLFRGALIVQCVLLLVACGGQSQTVTRNEEAQFVTLESLAGSRFGRFVVREYTLPSEYSSGTLHHKRGVQPNLVYISHSGSYDFIVWNGDDNVEHDAAGAPVPNSTAPNDNVSGDGLYLGRVTKSATPNIEQLHYFPPRSLSVSTRFVQGAAASVYPHRLMGATLDANNRINIARTLGNDVFLSHLSTNGLLAATPPTVTTTDITVNNKLQNTLLARLEYQVMTGVRDSEQVTDCMGGASLASASRGSAAFLALAYNRGYTFDNNNSVVGESFARYDVYQDPSNSGGWQLLQQNVTPPLNMQELRTVRTHRSCSDKVASHSQHNEMLIASYTDVGNVRLAFIDTETRLQSKAYVLRDVAVDNGMEIVGLVPLPDGRPLANGSISQRAYALVVRYISSEKLALYDRTHASLAYFVINDGALIPANDAPENIQFIFPDVIDGINNTAVGLIGNFVAVVADDYLTLLNFTGTIAHGPFLIEGGYEDADYGEQLFTHSDGSLGWVEYPTTTSTSAIRVFSYLPQ